MPMYRLTIKAQGYDPRMGASVKKDVWAFMHQNNQNTRISFDRKHGIFEFNLPDNNYAVNLVDFLRSKPYKKIKDYAIETIDGVQSNAD